MRFNIAVAPDEATFDRVAAERIVERLCQGSVLGLSTGRTTGNMHRLAAEIFGRDPFDLSRTTIFGLDEVTGVDREYAGACYKMLKTEIVDSLHLRDDQFLMLPTRSADFDKAARDFETELARRGGIDLLVLGLGENGHLGFNQPGTPFGTDAFAGRMHPELEERIRKETGATADEELGGITLGIRSIMHARRILLVAKGSNKAEVVKRILTGSITEDWPGSVLQLHPNCEFLLDSEAAKLLP